MSDSYRVPKMIGQRVPLRPMVPPEIHRLTHERAKKLGLSASAYIEALIARDLGMPSQLDDIEQGRLQFEDETRRTA